MLKKILPLFLVTFLFIGCNKDFYQVKSFKQKTKDHTTIAILPVEMVFSGLKPFELSEEDLEKQEEGESKAFQISLYNELLKRKENTKKGPNVKMQKPRETNKLLEENEISIRDSWDKPTEELAEILGVEAVVKSRIEKKRYFSDLASFGIDVASKLIALLAKDLGIFAIGQDLKKSNDIYSRYELIDGDSGEILWSMSYEEEANYKNPADVIIGSLNENAAKRFPYKKK